MQLPSLFNHSLDDNFQMSALHSRNMSLLPSFISDYVCSPPLPSVGEIYKNGFLFMEAGLSNRDSKEYTCTFDYNNTIVIDLRVYGEACYKYMEYHTLMRPFRIYMYLHVCHVTMPFIIYF